MTISIALNRSEHGALACEGYIGPINVPNLLGFEGAVSPEAMREALWQTTLAWPRMRGVMAPTWLSWRLEILPEGPQLRQLVDHAFRVSPSVEAPTSEQLQALQQDELNNPLCLERGLPWRALFMAHPTHPVLLLNVHHLVGDGHSMFLIYQSILNSLNGRAVPSNPVQSGNQSPALMPQRWWRWPASMGAWWRNTRRDAARRKGREVLRLATRTSPRYTVCSLRHVVLPLSLSQAKAAAKRHGATLNVLMAALFAEAMFSRDRARTAQDPQPLVDLRMPVDLRRYFPPGQAPSMGNLVGNVTVCASRQPDIGAQMADLKLQSQDQMGRLERRELALPYRLQDGFALLGRRMLSKILLSVKASGRAVAPSVFISNIGPVDAMSPADDRIRLTSLWTTSVGAALFVSVASVAGEIRLVFTWQCDETDAADVDALIEGMKVQCERLHTPAPSLTEAA